MANKASLKGTSMIKVINNTTGSMSFYGADGKKYLFPKSESFRTIQLSIIENLYNDYPMMLNEGIIIFEDKRVYDYLDIQEDVWNKILPLSLIEKFLEKDADEMEKELKEMPKSIQENVATVAKEKKIDSKRKTKAIKEATGFDIEEIED